MPPCAVSNACRKYLAGDTARRKPLPGDILRLARSEMNFIYGFQSDLRALGSGADAEPVDEVARARIGERLADLAASLRVKAPERAPDWKPEPGPEDKEIAWRGGHTASDALLNSPLLQEKD